MPEIERLVVIVPANDEEVLLGAALDSIWIAAAQVEQEVEVVVVANGCRDATAEVAASRGVHVIVQDLANVGAARAAGAQWGMRRGINDLWLATTDADSRVPAHWLAAQQQSAAAGFDVFLGTVCLPHEERERHRGWVDRYLARSGHVHGANLGVRAIAYSEVGGFRPLPVHEDRDLVTRLEWAGYATASVGDVQVVTSSRTDPRAHGGVGTDLARELLA